MGQRGPAPQPVALRMLKGETRPSQIATAPGPQDPPSIPDDLAADAAKVWQHVLANVDHIGQSHTELLRQYCETTAAANAMKPKGSREWQSLVLVSLKLARDLCLTPATGGNLTRKPTTGRTIDKYIAKTS